MVLIPTLIALSSTLKKLTFKLTQLGEIAQGYIKAILPRTVVVFD
jgi:hypothetical protein